MGRPRLIEQETAVAAALEIIDREGLDGFNLERLAAALGVRAPSLYHHFADKSEILSEVARIIVLETPRISRAASQTWQDWYMLSIVAFRRVLLKHPAAAPIVMQYFPSALLASTYDQVSRVLEDDGVPNKFHMFILEATHRIAIGSALCAASGRPALAIRERLDRDRDAHLLMTIDACNWDDEDLFRASVQAILDQIPPTASHRPTGVGLPTTQSAKRDRQMETADSQA
jgi:AcrR family transcriptional regulator